MTKPAGDLMDAGSFRSNNSQVVRAAGQRRRALQPEGTACGKVQGWESTGQRGHAYFKVTLDLCNRAALGLNSDIASH